MNQVITDENNICIDSDSYKGGHHDMYVEGTRGVYSYLEAREKATFNKTLFNGQQIILKKHFIGQIVTKDKIDEAQEFWDEHIGPGVFHRKGWEKILYKYDGRLPLLIRSVPEGMAIPINHVLATYENTDWMEDPKECDNIFSYWLTNYSETLLQHTWYPCTVGSLSREVKIMLNDYAHWTCDTDDHVKFQLHDFGYRGVSSVESAGIGGMSHIINFFGTDTTKGIRYAKKFYGYQKMPAFSVRASEHSIMTSLGPEGEGKIIESHLNKYPTGIISEVADSFNHLKFVDMVAKKFKTKVLEREGKFVFRPDSGDPVSVSGDMYELLEEFFGSTKNSKGYKVLHPKVGLLWGDGIDYMGIRSILASFRCKGWASSNIVFGMGGGLLQKVNRDTQRFAIKCSAQYRDGKWVDIFKSPLDSTKKSKKGRLALIKDEEGIFHTVSENVADPDVAIFNGKEYPNILIPVFKNGELLKDYTFEEVRANALL